MITGVNLSYSTEGLLEVNRSSVESRGFSMSPAIAPTAESRSADLCLRPACENAPRGNGFSELRIRGVILTPVFSLSDPDSGCQIPRT